MKRSAEMQGMLDNLYKKCYGLSNSDAVENKVCVFCKQPVGEFRDAVSAREWEISGMCQKCQEEYFNDEDE